MDQRIVFRWFATGAAGQPAPMGGPDHVGGGHGRFLEGCTSSIVWCCRNRRDCGRLEVKVGRQARAPAARRDLRWRQAQAGKDLNDEMQDDPLAWPRCKCSIRRSALRAPGSASRRSPSAGRYPNALYCSGNLQPEFKRRLLSLTSVTGDAPIIACKERVERRRVVF